MKFNVNNADIENAYEFAINKMARLYEAELKPKEQDDQTWDYVPNRFMNAFMYNLRYIRRQFKWNETPKLIDCGCGPGLTLALAVGMDFDAYGIDHNQEAVDIARSMFRLTRKNPNIRAM